METAPVQGTSSPCLRSGLVTATFNVTDPEDCTYYERTDTELQEFLIFCVCVAGKTARHVRKALFRFWGDSVKEVQGYGLTPFQVLRRLIYQFRKTQDAEAYLSDRLKEVGIGCYNLKARALVALATADIDLRMCTSDDLEKFPGIGPKTSRFYLLHTRPNAGVACLDTHILKFLRSKNVEGVPKQTPQGKKKYRKLEKAFLALVPEGKTPAQYDLEIWTEHSRK